MSFWQQNAEGITIAVKAQPGAKRVRIGPAQQAAETPGWPKARLKIAVTAPPEDGKANEAIIEALAKWLGVAESAVTLTAGGSARDKKFRIEGLKSVPNL